jgi:hypothetical protein
MFHRWAALVLVLALCAMSPKNAAGQQSSKPREPGAGRLGKNYPNPFNPATSFPFDVDPDVCTDGSQIHVVSLQIYNLLMVPIAVPVLQGIQSTSTTPFPEEWRGQPLRNLRLGCGRYVGFWDGNLPSGKEAPSGPYIAQLFIDKKKAGTLKIFNGK